MAGLSSGGETVVLNALLAARYISLHTADPGNTGASEVSGGSYARQGPVTFANTGNNPTTAANDAVIEFPVATVSWATITHFGIWSASSAGTFYGSGALSASKLIDVNDIARFIVGALTVTAD
jgi:hypothetical protein